MTAAMIETENLSVSIGAKPILRGVAFQAMTGELTAVIGPNGSAKTTLIRAICGDLSYSGRIAINGRDLRDLKPWRMAALRAVLPQAASIAFPFTVREVVALGLAGGGAGAREKDRARLPELALERVDLGGFGGRFYQELSGGEQQRVQLARVLCQVWEPAHGGEPRWLILDEPVSSLDIRHQLMVMEVAADFARRGGGVVAVLHDLNLTAMFADRAVLMHRGRMAASGPPGEVLRDDLLSEVFGCPLRVNAAPSGRIPFVLPQAAGI